MTSKSYDHATRLEYLRGELRGERISYGELAELQSLAPYIEAGDVELLEAAGVPESEAERRLELAQDGREDAGAEQAQIEAEGETDADRAEDRHIARIERESC